MRINQAFCSLLVIAGTVAEAQQRPAIRALGATVAKSTEAFPTLTGIRHLPDGRVLVNDIARRRVILLDSSLAAFSVIADSTSATGNAYSGRIGGLVPFRGDSTIFVDPTSMSMLLIDPAGRVARVMSVPRSQHAGMLMGGSTGFDATGRLIYRSGVGMVQHRAGAPGGTGGMNIPDSAAIVRIDLATRQLDTLTFIRTPKIKMDISHDADGRMSMRSQINPLPVVDDWAVTSDGTLAVVRGSDYHVDWFTADGKKTSSAKLPFEWQRLSDEDKVALIDSVKAARERLGANAPMMMGGGGGGGGGGSQQMIFMGMTVPSPGARGSAPVQPPPMNFVAAAELPDYKPPFFAGQLRPDAEGNIWIRTIPTKSIPGGPVYDVIDRKGALVERVQIPSGRSIVGFGSGGVVYMAYRQNDVNYLEKARVR